MIPKLADNVEYAREEWLPIVKEQERKLVFPAFTRNDAMNLGLRIGQGIIWIQCGGKDHHGRRCRVFVFHG